MLCTDLDFWYYEGHIWYICVNFLVLIVFILVQVLVLKIIIQSTASIFSITQAYCLLMNMHGFILHLCMKRGSRERDTVKYSVKGRDPIKSLSFASSFSFLFLSDLHTQIHTQSNKHSQLTLSAYRVNSSPLVH